VAYEVAHELNAPLDILVVRKLGVPGHAELAMGAIASGGIRVLNDEIVRDLRLSSATIEAVVREEEQELARRERLYRGSRPPPEVGGQTILLIDDGIATGATMHAAVKALRRQAPRRLVVAVPTAAPETCAAFRAEVDEMVCVLTPELFFAVGFWYQDFSPTTDEEVRQLLERAAHEHASVAPV
jgi:predicted phosphoribosyltransferase